MSDSPAAPKARPDLEEAHARRAVPQVARDRVQQPRQQRGAQVPPARIERVQDGERLEGGVGQPEPVPPGRLVGIAVHEGGVDGLVETRGRGRVGEPILDPAQRLLGSRPERPRGAVATGGGRSRRPAGPPRRGRLRAARRCERGGSRPTGACPCARSRTRGAGAPARRRRGSRGRPPTGDAAAKDAGPCAGRGTGSRERPGIRARPSPPSSTRRRAARFRAPGMASRSVPRSNRCDASVCMPSRRAVRRIVTGSHQAASSRTLVVSAVTAVARPPMIPARETGRSASATTMSELSSVRSTPSSVTSFSPRAALRMMRSPPASLSKSNAWRGWPVSHRT